MMENNLIINIINGIRNNKKMVYSTLTDYDIPLEINKKFDLTLMNMLMFYWTNIPENKKEEKMEEFLSLIEFDDQLIRTFFEVEDYEIFNEMSNINHIKNIDSKFMKLWKPELNLDSELIPLDDGRYLDDNHIYGFELLDNNKIKIYQKSTDSKLEDNEFYENEFIVANIINDEIIEI
jgi:hypothetical protein